MANSDRRFSQGASHEDPHSARATTQSADATDQAEQPAAAGAPFRYWAFISYSSLDRDTAIWLINRVEAYRIPDNLVGTNTSIGPIPKRLYPLFRDRDELRAGPDLKEALEQALRASRYLVVLCSPHAAKASSWVNEEIRYFQQLGRGHEIIPLIVSGEPNATLHGRGDLECFPPALRAADSAADHPEAQVAEPLAADLYREDANPRQSRRKALLKVIARMIDVDFDDLAQRDHKRRLQRLRRIAALSGAVVTVLVAAVTQWYWQSVENNVKTMVREAKQVQQYDPELAALLSLRAYAMDPSVAAYDGLIAVATSNPHFQSILHRGQRPEAAAIDYDDDLVAVAACVDDSCAKHALSLYRQGRTDPIGEPVVISADAVIAVAFRPDRPEVFVTAHQDHADKILKLTYGEHGWDAKIDEYWAYKHQIGPIAFSRGSGRSAIVFGKWDEQFVYTKVQVRGEDDRPVCTQEAYAPIDRIAFSPDGQTLAFVSDHHVQLLDINTCKVRRPSRFTTHRSGDVGFGATATELLSVGYDGILYRLDPAGEAAHAIGAPLRFSALDYHHLLSPGARYLASREKAAIYLMDIERYLDLVDDRRELRDTPYEYIAERELRAYQAAYLKLDDHPVRNYNFSPSGGLLYTISEGGVVALWRTSPYSIDTIVEPPDPTWQCPEEGCQGIGGRIQSASARDADRGLIARLQTSLTECGGDKKQDCLLISSLTVEDEQTGLTVRGFELRERSGPLWQRQTRVDFQEDGALLVATGKTVRRFRLDLASLIQRICMMAGDQGRIEETDLYLDRTMRTLMPAIGRRTMFCASRKSVNSGAHPG